MGFSIKSMLVAVALIAVSIVGLHYASLPWAAFFYTAAFLLVLTGIVGSLVCSWPVRAFWIGFAVFGGGYFWLALMAEGSLRFGGYPTGATLEPKLATTHLLLWSEIYLRAEISPRGTFGVQRGPTGYFVQVGHSIFTLLFALAGGKLGQCLVQRRGSTPDT
ncbi:MAG: hypothetical protein WD468_02310 [Pirellulales bacterium]